MNPKPFKPLMPITSWKEFKQRPLVISGPCSAESETQVLQTATRLSKTGRVDIFRAGLWKPRTRPGNFEGVGSKGLQWLKRVKEETGLSTATEVANSMHVYEALKYGVDYLWVGARSTVNPFVVQEIAEALKGSDVGVLVKNPVNPEPELWVGAIERILAAGISKIGAIHRGFASFEKSPYRNSPHWLLPIELKEHFPNLPLICDPSHICGNRHMLAEVAQKAMDLNFEGLMIESHIRPDDALSDSKQQLTPEALLDLLQKLVMRKPESGKTNLIRMLDDLRHKIDIFDEQLIDILEKRMKVVGDIAMHKKENHIAVLQSKRWAEVVRKNIEAGTRKGMNVDFITNLFRHIHQESINHQTRIMNE